MRIAIDAHSVGTGLGGNESYATNLITALAEIDQQNEYVLYVTRREAVERFQNRWPNFTVRTTLPHTPLIRVPVTLSAELRRRPVDVLHVQYTAPPFVPCPVVTTIHDLSFEHFPETFKRRSTMQLRLTVRYTARKAAHVLTDSEYSRRDIVETYQIPNDLVTVAYAASPDHFAPATEAEIQRIRRTYGIEGDYILAVGSIQPRKNLVRLMSAYSDLLAKWREAKLPKLVLVGKRAWLYNDTVKTIGQLQLSKFVIMTGYVPETDLPGLYSGAQCFVYPSFFEGFGLPPLEAMKCGAPVIVGNRTSLPEVVGNAALLVDPFDIKAIASAIESVLKDPQLRESLKTKGFEQASRFTWRDTAAKTLSVYEKVAQRHKRAKRVG